MFEQGNFILELHNPPDYEERYIIEFKRDYYLQTKYDLELQVPHLGRLADYYKKRYEITKHWPDCLKVRYHHYIQLCSPFYFSTPIEHGDFKLKVNKAFTMPPNSTLS